MTSSQKKVNVYGVQGDRKTLIRSFPFTEAVWKREMQCAQLHNQFRRGPYSGERLLVDVAE